MVRARMVVLAAMRLSLVALTVFTVAVAVRVLGGDLPPGHPPIGVDRLPAGHPPLDGPPVRAPPLAPVFPQGGTSTI